MSDRFSILQLVAANINYGRSRFDCHLSFYAHEELGFPCVIYSWVSLRVSNRRPFVGNWKMLDQKNVQYKYKKYPCLVNELKRVFYCDLHCRKTVHTLCRCVNSIVLAVWQSLSTYARHFWSWIIAEPITYSPISRPILSIRS